MNLDGPENSSYWSTVNARELFPGVCTPLSWSFYGDTSERVVRRAFHAMGVLRRADLALPAVADERYFDVFWGRAAVNIDRWRRTADLIPGSSGDAMERQFFGAVREGVESRTSPRRYPAVAGRLPVAAYASRRQVVTGRRALGSWWKDTVAVVGGADPGAALATLEEAQSRYLRFFTAHVISSFVAQGIFEQLGRLAGRAGLAGLESELVTGYGALEETALLHSLWGIAHGGEPAAGVIAEYGYLGSGELAEPSWRENPKPVESLIARYRDLPPERSPSASEARQREQRLDAEHRLLRALPRPVRPAAGVTLRLGAAYLPHRETGRAGVLMLADTARAAARRIGDHFATAGALDRPDDVVLLTLDEMRQVMGGPSHDLAGVVAARRERRQNYESILLPDTWTGRPEPVARDGIAPDPTEVVTGLGVHGQPVEGIVRVVLDPFDATDFQPGEILVCPITDPSWVSLFYLAAAVVVDIGGPLSHGAIVARELGLPCVVNTGDGTRRLSSGQRVRVDPTTGTVTPLP